MNFNDNNIKQVNSIISCQHFNKNKYFYIKQKHKKDKQGN